MVRNYFKVGKSNVVFITRIDEAWQEASALSDKTGDRIWIFKPVLSPGPWQNCPIIGHRPIEDIAKDLREAFDLPESATKRGLVEKYREEYKAASYHE